jgi:hypothetical protein
MVFGRPSQSIVLEMLHPKADEQVISSVAVHHPVLKISVTISFRETKRHTGLPPS